jgi:hypothetical protein
MLAAISPAAVVFNFLSRYESLFRSRRTRLLRADSLMDSISDFSEAGLDLVVQGKSVACSGRNRAMPGVSLRCT